MRRRISIFYSALMLTAVNLLLRFVGTSFQVYISRRIGPAGVGLLQLTMSVGSLAMVAGMAGIRTTTMYLTAEELGSGKTDTVPWILSGCFRYSLIASGTLAMGLFGFTPYIARYWIGDIRVIDSLRLFSAFLPVSCLCGVMTGYFTAASRIGTLAIVEVAEQFFSMGITLLCLTLWAGRDPGKACQSVILGSSLGAGLTLSLLVILHLRDRERAGPRIPVLRRLMAAAVPLAAADDLRSGISTLENLMVPKRLALNPRVPNALAAFGILSGMVFPVLMFPACILFALAELLIPELARCQASGNPGRIQSLVKRSLHAAFLYGLVFGGGMCLAAPSLGMTLYKSEDAGIWLRRFSSLIPMLYCDAIVDAMTKGLGQQRICVRYNILTSGLDVIFLFFLLPKYGMEGYFLSFLVTHVLNFILSIRRLMIISAVKIPLGKAAMGLAACLFSLQLARLLPRPLPGLGAYLLILICCLTLLGLLRKEDLMWLKSCFVREPVH